MKILKNKLTGRDIHEQGRVATPLELLFDLTFVVAVAVSSSVLHHATNHGHVLSNIIPFLEVFMACWWAWMNYTWFASAYGKDDATFHIVTMIQMIGVLIFATGISSLFHTANTLLGVIGYAVMRVGLVFQWFRAAASNPEQRKTCLRYAVGILAVQLLWISRIWYPQSWIMPTFILYFLFEMLIPIWAESAGGTPWHAHHIAERYGLFTIISIGECILGASNSIAGVIQTEGLSFSLAITGLGSVSLIFALWWLYFILPSGQALHKHRDRAFVWGYAHFFVFASLAAIGSGLSVAADIFKKDSTTTISTALSLIGICEAIYIIMVCGLYSYITRAGAKNLGWVIISITTIAAIVGGSYLGLPLSWGILLLNLPIFLIITFFECGQTHHSEKFQLD